MYGLGLNSSFNPLTGISSILTLTEASSSPNLEPVSIP